MRKIIFFTCFISLVNAGRCSAQIHDFHDCRILELILKDSSIRSFFYIDNGVIQPVNLNDANKYFKCNSITVNGKTHRICSGFDCGPIKFFIEGFKNDSLKIGLIDLPTGNNAYLFVIKKNKKYALSKI